jgi:hypothetical protein
MFSSLLGSANVRLFQTIDEYSSFEWIKLIYKTYGLSKEERMYVTKQISPNSFNAWECT